jgi:hypothetical protein
MQQQEARQSVTADAVSKRMTRGDMLERLEFRQSLAIKKTQPIAPKFLEPAIRKRLVHRLLTER